MNTLTKYFPWVVVGAFVLYAASKMYPKRETYKEFDLSAFGAIPVLDGGRLKPLDSVARANMLYISGRSDWEDPQGDTRPAILWLLEVMAAGDPRSSPIADYQVFRVDNEQVLAELGLPYRPGFYRYSWNEIVKSADKFYRALNAAKIKDQRRKNGEKVPDEERDLFHGKIVELANRLQMYEQLATRKTPTVVPRTKGGEDWLSLSQVDGIIAESYERSVRSKVTAEVDEMHLKQGLDPNALTAAEAARREQMINGIVADTLRGLAERERKSASPAAAAFGDILRAYRENKPKGFAEAIRTYRAEHLEPLHPSLRDTTKFETAFNAASPFFVAALMYVFAGVFMGLSWLGWTDPLRKAAFGLVGVAVVLNVAGLLGRMYLMGRPLVFVTNLYSSALMIGCAGVIGCLVVERFFKNGIALVTGCVLGAVTVKIAHHLSTDGNDTLGMLQAVLDTNFWLASHVTTITLGYAATYMAGLLGIVYIAWGLFFTTLTKEKHLAVGNMIYGVVCFATLLSFVGTVLGGIWADQSWGRFWGWDPKENGAVLIVIWNSLILHARWGGVVKQRGMAVLAVVGIMVTTWSWFGTNQLGVGLHAYGFSKTLAEGCKWTWLGSMFVIALGLVPTRYWRSFAPDGEPKPGAPAPTHTPASSAAAVAATPAVSQPQAKPAVNGHAANASQPAPAKRKKSGKRR
jgi:ABC-type transport system involved in cytochrome c biogenesis permease subunit